MDSTFVRKDFYVTPPPAGSSPEVWDAWLKADRKEAIKAKAKFTRSQKAGEVPTSMQQSAMRKINGVWKATTPIGFAGSVEDGGQLEPMVEATQELDLVRTRIVDGPRGTDHHTSGTFQRKAAKSQVKSRNSHFAMLRRRGKI